MRTCVPAAVGQALRAGKGKPAAREQSVTAHQTVRQESPYRSHPSHHTEKAREKNDAATIVACDSAVHFTGR